MRLIRLGVTFFAVCVIGFGCRKDDGAVRSEEIVVGSKNFTEQLLLGELMACLLEAETEFRVKRLFNLGGTMICHEGLVRGQIDLYAEYTGTALTAILKREVIADPDEAYGIVADEYLRKYRKEWLKPFGFNNTYAITVRQSFAEKHGLGTISELARLQGDLTAGFTAEFMEREDGYPGLREAYKLTFEDVREMDPGIMYQAIAQENVDVICAFATDGRIAAYGLKMLEDDAGFFPPYYAAPVVGTELLKAHPGVRGLLASLGGLIDDATMRRLNNEVDRQKRAPADVASEFLKEKGLLESENRMEGERSQ